MSIKAAVQGGGELTRPRACTVLRVLFYLNLTVAQQDGYSRRPRSPGGKT